MIFAQIGIVGQVDQAVLDFNQEATLEQGTGKQSHGGVPLRVSGQRFTKEHSRRLWSAYSAYFGSQDYAGIAVGSPYCITFNKYYKPWFRVSYLMPSPTSPNAHNLR